MGQAIGVIGGVGPYAGLDLVKRCLTTQLQLLIRNMLMFISHHVLR